MNIVTIDPSLNCTAVIVNGKRFAFANSTLSLTKKDKLTKWFELAAPFVTYHHIRYNNLDDYSSNEINKLGSYDDTTSTIRDVILENIDSKDEIQVYIEGYSYSSNAGKIIDLVTFGTLIRKKLYDITEYIHIIAPTELKVLAAKMTYAPIKKGKKVIRYEFRNNEGLAGGSFKKPDILKAIVENNNLQDEWATFLRIHQTELLNYKSIVKPIEDLNDAYILFNSYKNI